MVRDQLVYYPTVTREPFRNRGRITDLMTSGKLFEDIGLPLGQVRREPRAARAGAREPRPRPPQARPVPDVHKDGGIWATRR
jgi:hypothetical protein